MGGGHERQLERDGQLERGQVPNAQGATAIFRGAAGSGNPVIDSPGDVIGTLTYVASAGYNIQGPGTLAFSVTSGSTAISMTSTSVAQTISAPVSLANDLVVAANASGITVSGGITESGGSRQITVSSGLMVLGGTNAYTGNTNINNGATLQMGGTNAAAPGSTMALVAGATLDLNSADQVIGGLSAPAARSPPAAHPP